MTHEEIEQKFIKIIKDGVPKFYYKVKRWEGITGRYYLKIVVAASDYKINNVANQTPQTVSLSYDLESEELTIQIYGGIGGNHIIVKPKKHSNSYCQYVKIPFRKSKGLDSSLKNLDNFLTKYKIALKINQENLLYQDIVNYDELLQDIVNYDEMLKYITS